MEEVDRLKYLEIAKQAKKKNPQKKSWEKNEIIT